MSKAPVEEHRQSGIRALARGLRVIEILSSAHDGLPLTDIAHSAGLSKSSAHRLLQTLVDEGFVVQDSHPGYYGLSLKLLRLAAQVLEGIGIDELAQPALEKLAAATGETVHMAVLDGTVGVYVQKIDSPSAIRMYSRVGRRVPLHCTAVGKALLAWLPEEQVTRIVATEGLPRFTPNTITDVPRFMKDLATIRERGYAVDAEEHEMGIHCIGAPVFGRNDRVVASVSITALTYRVDRHVLLSWWPHLRQCVQELSSILKHLT